MFLVDILVFKPKIIILNPFHPRKEVYISRHPVYIYKYILIFIYRVSGNVHLLSRKERSEDCDFWYEY